MANLRRFFCPSVSGAFGSQGAGCAFEKLEPTTTATVSATAHLSISNLRFFRRLGTSGRGISSVYRYGQSTGALWPSRPDGCEWHQVEGCDSTLARACGRTRVGRRACLRGHARGVQLAEAGTNTAMSDSAVSTEIASTVYP